MHTMYSVLLRKSHTLQITTGFPTQCPEGCKCKVFDCHDPTWGVQCGFPEGFCDMLDETPEYKIDWIRVYQDVDNEIHKVGCSTPERPTRKWIQAHQNLYKTEDDVHPLKEVQVGGGRCDPKIGGACGGEIRGQCRQGGVCECTELWTGPHCLAHRGMDPIIYDAPDRISDLGFILPGVAPFALLAGMGVLGVMLLINIQWRSRLDKWKPLRAGYEEIDDEKL
jgi:beta-glucan synthesis-associated protein KRE6